MSKELLLVIVIVIVVILLSRQNEYFDTYWNHTIEAQPIYAGSNNSEQKLASKRLDDTELLAKYTWSIRDKDGTQLYDSVYESTLKQNAVNTKLDPTYYKRDLEQDYLDTKFQTMNLIPGDDEGATIYAVYKETDMKENYPLYTYVNGEKITLSQKTF